MTHFVVALLLGAFACVAARAETLLEFSAETQMQLDFHVPDAALAAMLPDGFAPKSRPPAGQGRQRMVFIDRGDITEPDKAARARRTSSST